MAIADRPSKNRRVTAAVVLALGLALVAVVATVGNSGSEPWQFDALKMDQAAADGARKASYQGNVATVYDHLQQIIDKILWHKAAWSKSYEGDLTRVAKEVAAAVEQERSASKESEIEAGKAAAAAAIAADKKSAWVGKAAALTAKRADAEEEKKALKALFDKGNAQKGGEIEMIKKIRCMMSAFNKDGKWKCDGSDPDRATTDTLAPGGKLRKDEYLLSRNGQYKAIMQGDGNFVVYKGNSAEFNTHSSGNNGAEFVFQSDGNLVVYSAGHHAKWNSDTSGRSANRLVMQDDGNLVLYNDGTPRWSSKHGRA